MDSQNGVAENAFVGKMETIALYRILGIKPKQLLKEIANMKENLKYMMELTHLMVEEMEKMDNTKPDADKRTAS